MASTHDVLSDPSPGKEEEELYREMFGVSAVDNREFLNIGAGRFKHAAWRNVDYWQSGYENLLKYSKPDIDHDLSKCEPINVPDQSIHIVYTSHTIEHLLDHHVSYVFNDVFRMLRSGGLIRVVCPSADLAYYAFLRNDMRYFRTFTTVRVGGLECVYVINFDPYRLVRIFMMLFLGSLRDR
jgi:ubiquinone/menaquinone biosynthesis C-methylase UbiE